MRSGRTPPRALPAGRACVPAASSAGRGISCSTWAGSIAAGPAPGRIRLPTRRPDEGQLDVRIGDRKPELFLGRRWRPSLRLERVDDRRAVLPEVLPVTLVAAHPGPFLVLLFGRGVPSAQRVKMEVLQGEKTSGHTACSV